MYKSKQSINIIREDIGFDVGPDMLRAIQNLPYEKLEQIIEHVLSADGEDITLPNVTEVWPIITLRSSLFAAGGLYANIDTPIGVNLMDAWNPRKQGTGQWSDSIMRTLLYSHGMMIEDPLIATFDMFHQMPKETHPLFLDSILAVISSVSEIYPLLDDGIITTFYMSDEELDNTKIISNKILGKLEKQDSPLSSKNVWDEFENNFINGLASPSLKELWRQIRGGNRTPDIGLVKSAIKEEGAELVEVFIDIVKDINSSAVIASMAEVVASSIAANKAFGGGFDILCQSEMAAKMLFLGTPDPSEEVRVHELGNIDIPNIDGLSPIDAVKLRQDSDALSQWRSDLSIALDGAKRLREKNGYDFDTSLYVNEIMNISHNSLIKQMNKSRVFNTKTLVNYAIGLLGVLSPDTIDGLLWGIGGATAATLLQSVAEKERISKYLNRHYLVFRSTKG